MKPRSKSESDLGGFLRTPFARTPFTEELPVSLAPAPEVLHALLLCEGAVEPNPALSPKEQEQEVLQAWQLLVDTGTVWTLQGWFGRRAHALLEAGLLRPAPSNPG